MARGFAFVSRVSATEIQSGPNLTSPLMRTLQSKIVALGRTYGGNDKYFPLGKPILRDSPFVLSYLILSFPRQTLGNSEL